MSNVPTIIYCSLYKNVETKMDIIFTNSKNSKTNESNNFLFKPTVKIDLKRSHKHSPLPNFSADYIWKDTSKTYQHVLKVDRIKGRYSHELLTSEMQRPLESTANICKEKNGKW